MRARTTPGIARIAPAFWVLLRSIAAVWPVYELEGALIAFGPDLASAFAAAGVVATGDGVRIKGGRGFFGPVTLIPAS